MRRRILFALCGLFTVGGCSESSGPSDRMQPGRYSLNVHINTGVLNVTRVTDDAITATWESGTFEADAGDGGWNVTEYLIFGEPKAAAGLYTIRISRMGDTCTSRYVYFDPDLRSQSVRCSITRT